MSAKLLERLENDQFRISEAANDLDRAYRRGWNGAIHHVIGIVQVEAGLRELATAAPQLPRHWLAEFDVSDQDGEG